MRSLQAVRMLLREKRGILISDEELAALAMHIDNPPARPSECSDWAETEAVPLINELGRRLNAYWRERVGRSEGV